MTTPIDRPYAMVTVFGPAGSHRLNFNGELVTYYTIWEGFIEVSPYRLADLLNDAYTKGVEAERMRQGYETPEQTIARVNTPEHCAAMVAWAASLGTVSPDAPNPPSYVPTS